VAFEIDDLSPNAAIGQPACPSLTPSRDSIDSQSFTELPLTHCHSYFIHSVLPPHVEFQSVRRQLLLAYRYNSTVLENLSANVRSFQKVSAVGFDNDLHKQG
jgi:hypothetical protein